MKVDNFSAAVEFYSKAIALNPQNAVYYCNRYRLTTFTHITLVEVMLVRLSKHCSKVFLVCNIVHN